MILSINRTNELWTTKNVDKKNFSSAIMMTIDIGTESIVF